MSRGTGGQWPCPLPSNIDRGPRHGLDLQNFTEHTCKITSVQKLLLSMTTSDEVQPTSDRLLPLMLFGYYINLVECQPIEFLSRVLATFNPVISRSGVKCYLIKCYLIYLDFIYRKFQHSLKHQNYQVMEPPQM